MYTRKHKEGKVLGKESRHVLSQGSSSSNKQVSLSQQAKKSSWRAATDPAQTKTEAFIAAFESTAHRMA